MVRNSLFVGALCLVLLAAGRAQAQTDTLYVTDGDSSRLAIVRGGVLQAIRTTHSSAYPLTVTGTSMWIGRYSNLTATALEYTLAGAPTGGSVPYTDVFAVDGATDGTRSWQLGNAFNNTADVYVSPTVDFQGSTLAFSVTGTRLVGITFDTVTQTLWIADQANVYHYTTAGGLLGQFAHTAGSASLAYEPSTDTLWLVSNGTNDITQYSKAGVLLQTLTVAGLLSNNWGAEFGIVAAPNLARTPIPTLSEWGIVILAGLLAVFGLVYVRRVSA